MTAVWGLVLVASIGATSFASRRAVSRALRVAETLKISPAMVGLTVMAIGTDLPEIANSLVSSASGHGDVNVGDSMGSVLTQVTLTLGLLCLAGSTITTNRNFVIAVGTATVFAVVVVRILVDDGELSHIDGLTLILLWIGGTALLGQGELRPREVLAGGRVDVARDVASAMGWLAAVGLFAVGVVQSFLRIAEVFGVPEFVGSFIVLSIGTSLPELFVDWTAIRRGASSMAVGDVFGSSFVDATLSIGIGPAVFSAAVSSAVFTGTVMAGVGVGLATILVARSASFDWRLAGPLVAIWATIQIVIATLATS